jgi:hypothetical protein
MAQHLAHRTSPVASDSPAEPAGFSRFCIALASQATAALAVRRLTHLPVTLRVADPGGATRRVQLGHAEATACRSRAHYLAATQAVARAVEALSRVPGADAPSPGTEVTITLPTSFGGPRDLTLVCETGGVRALPPTQQ